MQSGQSEVKESSNNNPAPRNLVEIIKIGDIPSSSPFFVQRLKPTNNPQQLGNNYIDIIADKLEASSSVVLKGLPGCGKTQLAKAYLQRALKNEKYHLIIWVEASSFESILESYKAIAEKLKLSYLQEKPEDLIECIKKELQARENWLLVVHNAWDAERIKSVLPISESQNHILITADQGNYDEPGFSVIPMLAFNPKEAEEYLEKILSSHNHSDQTEFKRLISDLAIKLDYYPLALAQAASHIKKSLHGNIQRYIDLLRENSPALGQVKAPHDYPYTLQQAINITLTKLEEPSTSNHGSSNNNGNELDSIKKTSVFILKLLSLLSGERVSLSFLKACVLDNNEIKNDQGVDESINFLQEHCLIADVIHKGAETYISTHRVIQKAVKDRMEKVEVGKYLNLLIDRLNSDFNLARTQTKHNSKADELVIHARAIAEQGFAAEAHFEQVAKLYNSLGRYYAEHDKLDVACDMYKKSTEKLENQLNNINPDILPALRKLNTADAVERQKAQEFIRSLSPETLRIVLFYGQEVLHNMGSVLLWRWEGNENERSQVIPLLKLARSIQELLMNEKDPNYETIYYTQRNLANAYLKLNQPEEAKKLFNLVKQQLESRSDLPHQNEVQSLIYLDLCNLYKKKKENKKNADEDPEKWGERSLIFIDKVKEEDYSFGNKKKDHARILTNLAEMYVRLAEGKEENNLRLQRAESYLQQAKLIDKQYYHGASRSSARICYLLAQCNFKLEYFLTAEKYIDKAIKRQEEFYPKDHPYLQESRKVKQEISDAIKKNQEQKGLSIQTVPMFGLQENTETLSKLSNAEKYYQAGNYTEAEEQYHQFLRDPNSERNLHEKALTYYRLESIYQAQEKISLANEYYQKAKKLYSQLLKSEPVLKDLHGSRKLVKAQYESCLGTYRFFKLKPTAQHGLDFQQFFKDQLLIKLNNYLDRLLQIDQRAQAGEFTMSILAAISKALPKLKIGDEKASASIDIPAAMSSLFQVLEQQFKKSNNYEVYLLLKRLDLIPLNESILKIAKQNASGEQENVDMALVIQGALVIASKDQIQQLTDDLSKQISKIYGVQIEKLNPSSGIQFAGYLVNQIMEHMVSNYLASSLLTPVDRVLDGFLKFKKSTKLITNDGQTWQAQELLQCSGIELGDGRRFIRKEPKYALQEKYGYRRLLSLPSGRTKEYEEVIKIKQQIQP